jgi:hypothetical protein
MNSEVDDSNNHHKYVDILFNFCLTFEQEWAKGSIRDWSPPIDENVVKHLSRLQDDLQVILDKVESLFKHVHTQPMHWAQNEDEWALDRLKSILHEIVGRLRKMKVIVNLILTDEEFPEEKYKEGYEIIMWYSRQIDLLVKKAFPLLKENKSYLDIDWHKEFENLR